MIDYEGLHAKIKAKLRPDSPMPEVWGQEEYTWGFYEPHDEWWLMVHLEVGHKTFESKFGECTPASIEWFAEALGIPLHDNGYTDLVKAAEHVSEVTDAHYDTNDGFLSDLSDAKNMIEAALERIKSENP